MDPSSLPELSTPERNFSEGELEQAGLLSGFEREAGNIALPRPDLPAFCSC